MKTLTAHSLRFIPAALGLVSCLLAHHAGATVTTWDPQANNAQNPYTGDLSAYWESSVWSTSQTGQATPQGWVDGTAALFGVHTGTGTPAFTVFMDVNHTVAGIFDGPLTPNPCQVTISGKGAIILPPGLQGFDVTSDTGDPGSITINNVITDLGGANAAELTAEGSGQIYLNGANAYSGGTLLGYSGASFRGIINFNNSASFGTGGICISNTGTVIAALVVEGTNALTIPNNVTNAANAAPQLNLVGNVAGLTFSGNWYLNGNAKIGSGGASNNLVTISGVMSGAGGLSTFNPGILALTGTNSYTGPTTVGAGTLLVNAPGWLSASSTVTVNSGGTLGGTGTINGPTTVNAGGTLSTVDGVIDTLTFGSSLTLAGTTSLEINAGTLTADEIVLTNGTVTLGGNLTVVNLGGTPGPGETFQLFSGAMAGGFSSFTLPALPTGWAWDASQLASGGNGTIAVLANAAPVITNFTLVGGIPQFWVKSGLGVALQIEYATNLCPCFPCAYPNTNINCINWLVLTNQFVTNTLFSVVDVARFQLPQGYYRVVPPLGLAPPGMALIPGGTFTMGDANDGNAAGDAPMHPVTLSAFYMDQNLVSYSLWQTVSYYALDIGYVFDSIAGVPDGQGKAANHPVQTVDWFDCVKWCNARSELEGLTPCYYTDPSLSPLYIYRGDISLNLTGLFVDWSANGYRLPTEAEWERAARGGAPGNRFPWGDTIMDGPPSMGGQANYKGNTGYNYDFGPNGYNSAFDAGAPDDNRPYTSPVGSFTPNGYGLYDMAGNVVEWCWDTYDDGYYSVSPPTDPRGPTDTEVLDRVARGGDWGDVASFARCAFRDHGDPAYIGNGVGYRCVRGL